MSSVTVVDYLKLAGGLQDEEGAHVPDVVTVVFLQC